MNISFVIPAYNCEKTLKESVDSIFNHNFIQGDEVIIIDDASTDRTLEICNNLLNQYGNKIKIIKNKENKGCPASRNVGIKEARNEYVFNLDSDNILAPDSVPKLKNFLMEKNADVAAFQEYWYFKTDISKIHHKWICNSGLFQLNDLFAGHINPGPGGNYLYKRSIWERVEGYWEYGKGLHEAWGFTFKILVKGAKFMVMPDSFYFHRFGHQSLFVRENKFDKEIRVTNLFIENNKNIFENQLEHGWYRNLNRKPLKIKNMPLGKNGKLVYSSILKNIIKSIIRW